MDGGNEVGKMGSQRDEVEVLNESGNRIRKRNVETERELIKEQGE